MALEAALPFAFRTVTTLLTVTPLFAVFADIVIFVLRNDALGDGDTVGVAEALGVGVGVADGVGVGTVTVAFNE